MNSPPTDKVDCKRCYGRGHVTAGSYNLPRQTCPDCGGSGYEAPASAARPTKCPSCESRNPAHHPATSIGGEVSLCNDPWHQPTAAEIRAKEAKDAAASSALPPVAPVAEEVTKALRELADGYMRDSMGEKQELTIYGRTMRESIVAQALARLSAKSASGALTPEELRQLVDFHDNAAAGAEAQDYFDASSYHDRRAKHFKALLGQPEGRGASG